eukprot:UN02155
MKNLFLPELFYQKPMHGKSSMIEMTEKTPKMTTPKFNSKSRIPGTPGGAQTPMAIVSKSIRKTEDGRTCFSQRFGSHSRSATPRP